MNKKLKYLLWGTTLTLSIPIITVPLVACSNTSQDDDIKQEWLTPSRFLDQDITANIVVFCIKDKTLDVHNQEWYDGPNFSFSTLKNNRKLIKEIIRSCIVQYFSKNHEEMRNFTGTALPTWWEANILVENLEANLQNQTFSFTISLLSGPNLRKTVSYTPLTLTGFSK